MTRGVWPRFFRGLLVFALLNAGLLYGLFRLQTYLSTKVFSGDIPQLVRAGLIIGAVMVMAIIFRFTAGKPYAEIQSARQAGKRRH